MGGVDFKRADESEADGGDDAADDHEGGVVTHPADEDTADDDGHDEGEDHWDGADTGLYCVDAFDCLEVNGEVVDCDAEGGAYAECEPEAGGDAAVGDDAGWDRHIVVVAEDLESDEDADQEGEHDEEYDDARISPVVFGSAPLQCEQETDDAGQEAKRTERIQLHDLLSDRLAGGGHGTVDVED